MLTLFTGSPGAGKTASLVDYLSKLPGDRPIYSDGLDGLKIPHTPCDATRWHLDLPDGAILVVDEAQRLWRARAAGSTVPAAVQEFETHRHRGVDVFLTTQAPNLLDSNVRRLVGRHVHIRDTGILGRYWYEWPECNDTMRWQTCVNKRRFSLPKKAFELYKSSSLHTVPVRGVPKSLYVGIAALIVFCALAFGVYKIVKKTDIPAAPPAASVSKPHVDNASIDARGPALIDDRVDWIPRVSTKPESAPAYDHLRVVSVMPIVVGGFCTPTYCRCYTQQSTDPGLSQQECRDWIAKPPFNPYKSEPLVLPQTALPQPKIAQLESTSSLINRAP